MDYIKRVKHIVLSSDHRWQVRDQEEDVIYFLYKYDDGNANASTAWLSACCLGWPFAMLYAILGNKKGGNESAIVKLENGMLVVTGTENGYREVCKLLREDEVLSPLLLIADEPIEVESLTFKEIALIIIVIAIVLALFGSLDSFH